MLFSSSEILPSQLFLKIHPEGMTESLPKRAFSGTCLNRGKKWLLQWAVAMTSLALNKYECEMHEHHTCSDHRSESSGMLPLNGTRMSARWVAPRVAKEPPTKHAPFLKKMPDVLSAAFQGCDRWFQYILRFFVARPAATMSTSRSPSRSVPMASSQAMVLSSSRVCCQPLPSSLVV